MGGYFHDYLVNQGLLTGNTATDLPRLYFRANSIQRSNITAQYFGIGLIPGGSVPVHSYQLGTTDPVFDPVAGGIVTVDPDRAVQEAQGIYGTTGANGTAGALMSAYSGELSLIHGVLYPQGAAPLNPPGTEPPPPPAPPGPQGSYDPTTIPFTFIPISPVTNAGLSINLGGLAYTEQATDPFVMQYADNFDLSDVAWGRLTPDTLSQETRLVVQEIAIQMRLPYLSRVQSSNAASHVLRTMNQAVSGGTLRGRLRGQQIKDSCHYQLRLLCGRTGGDCSASTGTFRATSRISAPPEERLSSSSGRIRNRRSMLSASYYTSQTFGPASQSYPAFSPESARNHAAPGSRRQQLSRRPGCEVDYFQEADDRSDRSGCRAALQQGGAARHTQQCAVGLRTKSVFIKQLS